MSTIDQQLAGKIGSMCVSGQILTGEALTAYLRRLPAGDKYSLLEDLESVEPTVPISIAALIKTFRKRADTWEADQGELGKMVATEIRTVVDAFENDFLGL